MKNSRTIEKVWFDQERIYIRADDGMVYSRRLTCFPLLKEATPEQRAKVKIGLYGDDLRWDNLDEDIHISSFFQPDPQHEENAITTVFHQFPMLNVSEMARTIGINKSLLSRYIYGIKKPSRKREEEILESIRELGRKMAAI